MSKKYTGHCACGHSILQAPFPVSGYLSTRRVQQAADGNRSRVEWSGKFTPEGVSAVEASQLFQRIFEDGLKAMATNCPEMRGGPAGETLSISVTDLSILR